MTLKGIPVRSPVSTLQLMRETTEQPLVIVDTLRSPDRDLLDVLAKLAAKDAEAGGSAASLRRKTSGTVLDLPRMLIRVCHQLGHCHTYLIKPRDIHSNGIVFLHGSYVHDGAKCALYLRSHDGKPAQIAATILRCRHVSGRVHELVAVFDRAIQLHEYSFADGSPMPGVAQPQHAFTGLAQSSP